MTMRDEFDGFSIHLLQDEDNDFVAHFVELPNVSASGSTAEEVLSELKEAWEAIKESYRKHNEAIPVAPARKEYSGQFNVRIDKRDHRALAIEAAQAGLSLNALIAQKLHQAVISQRESDTDTAI
ncbi:MAG: DNA repair protein [Gammaproteobacteria bacterium RIFCSPHIGHO2_12_FULL_37_34]|nr:MAG: DNA repair protein [Gammaproteobacteria bacterium RIFCSPHIGHO2_12_FULL_37_34]